MSDKNVYRVRLLRWGDSSSSGRKVTLKLPDDEEDHPFKGLPVGAKNGQLLEMEIAIVEDDGTMELVTLGRVRKPNPKVIPRLPVVKAKPVAKPVVVEPVRKRAVLTNVTRHVIKAPARTVKATPRMPAPLPSQMISPPAERHAPPPQPSAPVYRAPLPVPEPMPETMPETMPEPKPQTGTGHGKLDSADLDAYANQMSQAAEALAAVAERMDDHVVDDRPQYPMPQVDDDPNATPGVKAVRRATDLCKAIDKQRAGFFYFMRSRYPQAPKLPGEPGEWSRDAKSTRDRVCIHCETTELHGLAQNDEARRKFEELETEFERHERLR